MENRKSMFCAIWTGIMEHTSPAIPIWTATKGKLTIFSRSAKLSGHVCLSGQVQIAQITHFTVILTFFEAPFQFFVSAALTVIVYVPFGVPFFMVAFPPDTFT